MLLSNRAVMVTTCLAIFTAAGCGGGTVVAPSSAAATISGTLEATPASTAAVHNAALAAATAGRAWSVAVAGTSLRTFVDAAGRFEIVGVPAGDIQLLFSDGLTHATLAVSSVPAGQTIRLDVVIEGDTATLRTDQASAAQEHKLTICHRTGSGAFHAIEIDRHAEPAHRDHGDAAVGERIPSDRTKVFDAACRPAPFGVTVETSVNGEKSDVPPGPSIPVGTVLVWRYVVVNLSPGGLTNVSVTDSRGVAVNCGGETTVPFGGAMTCTAEGIAVAGQYENIGLVTADSVDGPVEDTDPSHYFGVVSPSDVPPPGAEDDGKKVALCHARGDGSYELIEVARAAEPAHRAHGDARPGEGMPGRPERVFTTSCGVRP